MHFDFTDLRLFVHIAERHSLTRGAREACLSLPAASQRLRELEEQLGVRLFYRGAKGLSITPAGEEFLQHARRVLHAAGLLQAGMLKFEHGGAGSIRVFANTTAVTDFLPGILGRFLADHPQLSIDLQERLTNDIMQGVKDGAADLGVTSFSTMPQEDGIELISFSEDRLVLVVPAGHALARRRSAHLREVLTEPHIALHEGSTLHDYLVREAVALGQPLKLRVRVRSFEAQCRMVEAGVGVAITPQSAAERLRSLMRFHVVALRDDSARRLRCILLKRGQSRSEQTQALIEAITSYGAASAGGEAESSP